MCNFKEYEIHFKLVRMLYWDKYKTNIYETWRKYWFETHPLDIADYSWNYLFTGGKEIRAKLFCELWHYLSPDSEVKNELAFSIECIHVASIILDDTPWMDNASERRGKKTLHLVFSPKKAVLIAYDLISMALMIWKHNKPDRIDMESWTTLLKSKLQRLMVGQWYDLEKKGTLIELASLKTGVLFELVAEAVAVHVELDQEFWRIWGNNLGILFQWVDDWNDREEDIQQKNRNAFNENYNITSETYASIWNSIQKSIGKQWFTTEFGKMILNYFTSCIDIDRNQMFLTNLNSIPIEYPLNIKMDEIECLSVPLELSAFNFTDGKHMLKYLWKAINHIESNTKHDLWQKEEVEWNIPNI